MAYLTWRQYSVAGTAASFIIHCKKPKENKLTQIKASMQTSLGYEGSLSFRFWVGFRRENLSGVSFQRSNPPKSPECFHFIPARYGSLRKKHFQKDLKEPPWSQKNARNGQQVRLLTHFVAFFPSLRRKSEISSIEFFTHTNQSPPRFSYCDRTRSRFDSVT